MRELLAQAVQCLDGQPSVAPNASIRSDQGWSQSERSPRDNFSPAVASTSTAIRSAPTTSSCIAALAERNCLFNFTDRGKRGAGGSSSRKAKKKHLDVWPHDFICLARADQEKSPTAMERGTLITAGKHEDFVCQVWRGVPDCSFVCHVDILHA